MAVRCASPSANGLVGIKPSRGRISNGPLRDPVGTWSTVARSHGPWPTLPRCSDVMSGPFPRRPYYASARDEVSWRRRRTLVRRLRVGFFTDPIIADVPVDPESTNRRRAGRRRCWSDLGHTVEPTPAPFGPR